MGIEDGDRVRVHYVGRFEDGTPFATTDGAFATEAGLADARGRDPDTYGPVSFTVGAGEVVEGLEAAVRGMETGERDTVRVPPEAAYGEYRSDRVREYDPDAFERMVGKPPEPGRHVEARNELHGDVVAVEEDAVRVDFNHELAGKTLVFDLEVVAVE